MNVSLFVHKKSLLKKFVQKIKEDGVFYHVMMFVHSVLKQPMQIEHVKRKILKKLIEKHNYKVAHGPFKGMKLNENPIWSKYDHITQVLGVYEKNVLSKIIEFSQIDDSLFIDLGAADGYFAVGVASGGVFKKVCAFEINKKSQQCMINIAKNNDCMDKINIYDEANYDSIKKLLHNEKHSPTILIDIEGAEYTLLDSKMLSLLSNCNVICELHPWVKKNGKRVYRKVEEENLLKNASKFFDVEMIQRESYSPNDFEELSGFNEVERLIALSEGRGPNMHWLVLTPKKN